MIDLTSPYIFHIGFLAFLGVAAEKEPLTAKVGDRIVLPCYYSPERKGNPGLSNFKFKIRWYKGNQLLTYGKEIYEDNFEIESPVATETNLIIKAVVQTDEGIYHCKTTVDKKDIFIGEQRLIVETKPEIHDHDSSPIYIDVQEGQTVKIWCNVSGTPEPTVTWKRYLGRNDAATDIGATGNVLTIPNITKYATDKYVCHVANRLGELSREISVTVSFSVKANVYQREIFASPDKDVFMACMVEGNPIIEAHWRNVTGGKITTNWLFEVTEESQVGGFPLRLLQLKIRGGQWSEREFGYYTCYVAGNSTDDEATARVHLRRAEKTPDNKMINYKKKRSDDF